MTREKAVWNIVGGPSKFDLIESISHRKYPGADVELRIQGADGAESEVRKVKICILSQKGDSTVKEDCQDPQGWGFYGEMDSEMVSGHYRIHSVSVVGTYSTSTRRGTVREVDPDDLYQKLRAMELL